VAVQTPLNLFNILKLYLSKLETTTLYLNLMEPHYVIKVCSRNSKCVLSKTIDWKEELENLAASISGPHSTKICL